MVPTSQLVLTGGSKMSYLQGIPLLWDCTNRPLWVHLDPFEHSQSKRPDIVVQAYIALYFIYLIFIKVLITFFIPP